MRHERILKVLETNRATKIKKEHFATGNSNENGLAMNPKKGYHRLSRHCVRDVEREKSTVKLDNEFANHAAYDCRKLLTDEI